MNSFPMGAIDRTYRHAVRGVACGRKKSELRRFRSWRRPGCHHANPHYAARLNNVDPKAWLADALARIADLPVSRVHELLSWEWKKIKMAAIPVAA